MTALDYRIESGDESLPGNGSNPLAGLCAKLDVFIGSSAKLLQAMENGKPKDQPQPVIGRTVATGIAATGVPLVLRFPLAGPDQGHIWMVRNIAVGGLAVGVAAAGTADAFVSASDLRIQPALTSIGLGDWRDHYAAMPTVVQYGSGAFPLRFNEEVFVVISGGTNGQQYVASVGFIDYREAAIEEGWAL